MPQEHSLRIRIAHQSRQCLHCGRCQNWLCASPRNHQQCVNTACRHGGCCMSQEYNCIGYSPPVLREQGST